MNWGYKILFVYIIFVAGILVLVFKSSVQNQDLVTPDYYEQELKYQSKIDEMERANKLSAPVKFEIKSNELLISLPAEMKGLDVSAQVLLYCTADKSRDIQMKFTTKDGMISMPLLPSNKGQHELRISWTADKVNYYNQQKLFIQ